MLIMVSLGMRWVEFENFGNDINHDCSALEMQSLYPSPIASGGKRKKFKMAKNKETNNEIIELKRQCMWLQRHLEKEMQ
jgi:hypothetical protein